MEENSWPSHIFLTSISQGNNQMAKILGEFVKAIYDAEI